MTEFVDCPQCNGSGRVVWQSERTRAVEDCDRCDGTGLIVAPEQAGEEAA